MYIHKIFSSSSLGCSLSPSSSSTQHFSALRPFFPKRSIDWLSTFNLSPLLCHVIIIIFQMIIAGIIINPIMIIIFHLFVVECNSILESVHSISINKTCFFSLYFDVRIQCPITVLTGGLSHFRYQLLSRIKAVWDGVRNVRMNNWNKSNNINNNSHSEQRI